MNVNRLKAFTVENDDAGGLMLSCDICGAHHWSPKRTRRLTELVEQAKAHRKVCP